MKTENPRIPLPKSWPTHVRVAILHVISLAQFATAHTRSWAANSINARIRLQAERDRAVEELALLREEARIKDARMAMISPHRRPHYPPTERLAILELKAARGWSLEQTARVFHVTAPTIASWLGRLDEEGPDALVQMRTPVNRFPDFVRYIVQRLKALCPTMGKVKIAQTLARAGLHLGVDDRWPDAEGRRHTETAAQSANASPSGRKIIARSSNHTWHMDLTVVPTGLGFWVPWLPYALTQQFPFCWWVGVVVDHFCRRIMGIGVFANRPTAAAVLCVPGTNHQSDREAQVHHLRPRWHLRLRRVSPLGEDARVSSRHATARWVSTGASLSWSVILSLKTECIRHILVPLRRDQFLRELVCYQDWYNEQRPHTTLGGQDAERGPLQRRPANRRPRIEPRRKWPRGSPCAKPWALVAGKPGDECTIRVDFQKGHRHLPVVTLKRAA